MGDYDYFVVIKIVNSCKILLNHFPADIYLLKVNNRNTRTGC